MELKSAIKTPPVGEDTVASALAGEVVVPVPVPVAEQKPEGNELLYAFGESLFGAVAEKMVKLGWSVFPQTRDNGRKPGSVFGEMIKWSTIRDQRPDAATLETWVRHCRGHNVACVFGPASGHTFAVDIDVTDERLSVEVSDLADEILGYTPFRREGMAPKIALIYRHAPDDVVPSVSRRLAGTEHGIEILGAGKLLTFHGLHHKTGSYFKWFSGSGGGDHPLARGPEAVPLVTADQVKAFLAAVDARWKFATAYTGASAGGAMVWGSSEGVRVPQLRADAELERGPDGRITGGREEYLRSLVWRTVVLGNGEAYHAAVAAGPAAVDEFKANLGAAIIEEFQRCAVTDGRWRLGSLHREVTGRVNSLVAKALSGLIEIKCQPPVMSAADRRAVMPTITIRAGEITEAVDAAEAALIAQHRNIFAYNSTIVGIDQVDRRTAGGKVRVSRVIERDEVSLREDLANCAVFERFDVRKGAPQRIDPPLDVVRTLLARRGRWSLPLLEAQVSAPTLRPDGSVLDTPGYDEVTGLYYDPAGATFPAIPASPTRVDAEAALGVLWSAIESFPFVNEVDQSCALGALLTATIRRSLPSAPMFPVAAPVAGSGKTKLANIVAVIATGSEAEVVSQGRTEEENAKILGSTLAECAPVVLIDNCNIEIGGSFMEQLLTSDRVKVRILGKSEMRTVSTNALLLATGNNLVIARDMTRRCLPIRLDPGVERPETLEYEHEPVSEAKRRRPELVAAALTVLRAFHVAGRPRQATPLGSFEVWSSWIRDALLWLGMADPCLAIETARESDPKLEAMAAIITQWQANVGDTRVSVRQLIDAATKKRATSQWADEFVCPDFREALLAVAGDGGAVNGRRLGKWLSAHAGRLVNGVKIEKAGVLEGVQQWTLGGS